MTNPAPADDTTLPAMPELSYLGDDHSYGYEACDMAEYARDAVRADRASPSRADGWISVADRLPEAETEVLVAFAEQAIPSTGQYTGSPHDQGGWCYPSENRWTGVDGADPTITHWMPLPALPGTATVPAAVDVGAAQAETAQAAPAVLPLTAAQVGELVDQAGYSTAEDRANFINGIRWGERAHGITATPGATHGN